MEEKMETLLYHLARDIGYMGHRVQKDVQKCLKDLGVTHDNKKFCDKLSGILTQFSEHAIQYSKDLESRIKDCNKEEEYRDIINKLQKLSAKEVICHTCKNNEGGAETSNYLELPKKGADEEATKYELKNEVLSQHSLHINEDASDSKSELLRRTPSPVFKYEDRPTRANDSTDEERLSTLQEPNQQSNVISPLSFDNEISDRLDNCVLEQDVENHASEIYDNDTDIANSLEISHSEEIQSIEEDEELISISTDGVTSNIDKYNTALPKDDMFDECAVKNLPIPLPYESIFKSNKDNANANLDILSEFHEPQKIIALPYKPIFEKETPTQQNTVLISVSDYGEDSCINLNNVAESHSIDKPQKINVIALPYKPLFEKVVTVEESTSSDAKSISVPRDYAKSASLDNGSPEDTPKKKKFEELLPTDGTDDSDIEIITITSSHETDDQKTSELNSVAEPGGDSDIEIIENIPESINISDESTVASNSINESQNTEEKVTCYSDSQNGKNASLQMVSHMETNPQNTAECLDVDVETVKNITMPKVDVNSKEIVRWDAANITPGQKKNTLEQYRDTDMNDSSQRQNNLTLPGSGLANSEEVTGDDSQLSEPLEADDIENYSEKTLNNRVCFVEDGTYDSEDTIITSPLGEAVVNQEENDINETTPKVTRDKEQVSEDDANVHSKVIQKILIVAQKSTDVEPNNDVNECSKVFRSENNNSDRAVANINTPNDTTVNSNGDLIGLTGNDTAKKTLNAEKEEEVAAQDIEISQTPSTPESEDVVMENSEGKDTAKEALDAEKEEEDATQDIEIPQIQFTPEGEDVVMENCEGNTITQKSYVFNLDTEQELDEIAQENLSHNDGSVTQDDPEENNSDQVFDLESVQQNTDETANKKQKNKLEDGYRNSLLKVIAEYFLKRKREKALVLKETINDNKDLNKIEAKKKRHNKEHRKKSFIESKKNKKTQKPKDSIIAIRREKRTGENDADFLSVSRIGETSNSSAKISGDKVNVGEDRMISSDIDATQIKEFGIEINNKLPPVVEKVVDQKSAKVERVKGDMKSNNDDDSEGIFMASKKATKVHSEAPKVVCADTESNINQKESEASADSQVVSPFKRKIVKPLSSTESDGEGDINKETDAEDSEVVSPFKKKGVKRLQSSDESDSDPHKKLSETNNASESDISDCVKPLKRTSVKRPLSDEDESETARHEPENKDSYQERAPKKKRVLRLISSEENSLEELVIHSKDKKQSVNRNNKESNQEMSEETDHDIEPSQFNLNDKARDDFLDMFNQHDKDSKSSDRSCQVRVDRDSISETEDENMIVEASQFRLGDCDRDNLLNLLTDKENDERTWEERESSRTDKGASRESKTATKSLNKKEINAGLYDGVADMSKQFKLNSKERDEFLDLFSAESSNDLRDDDKKMDTKSECRKEKTAYKGDNIKNKENEPSQFKLNSADRDEFLEMLTGEQSNDLSVHGDGKAKMDQKEANLNENESSEPSQFKLNDKARDDLLDMFSENQSNDSGNKIVEKGPSSDNNCTPKPKSTSYTNLLENIDSNDFRGKSVNGRDEDEVDDQNDFEDTVTENSQGFDDVESDEGGSEKLEEEIDSQIYDKSSDFKLDENEKNELLNLLCDHIKKDDMDSCSDSDVDQASDNINENGRRKKMKTKDINRDMLLELLREYENAVREKDNTLFENIENGDMEFTNVDSENTSANSDFGEDSSADSESVLLDLLREETVEQPDEGKRRKKPRDNTKEAWEAYRQLLKDSEEFSDTSSEVSNLDIDDLELDLSDQERKKKVQEVHHKLMKKFNIEHELIINVERTDISQFELSSLPRRDGNTSSRIDRLCDISNVLQKRKKPERKRRKVKIQRLSPSASSRGSDSDSSDSLSSTSTHWSDDFQCANQDSGSNRGSPFQNLSDDNAEQEKLASALWENIKNSSDENSGWSSDSDTGTSDDDENRKMKEKKSGKQGRVVKESNVKDDMKDDASNEKSENDDSDEEESGDNEKKEGDVNEADLDSSDEEDFVGVRKSKGAWKHDPLLKSCFTSDDESDSDGADSQKARTRLKIKKRLKQKHDDVEMNSDVERDGATTPTKGIENSSDSDVEFVMEKKKTPKKTIEIDDEAEDDSPTKRAKGRRNIRALFEDDELAEATKKAKKEESERIKRLQERERAKESFTHSQQLATQLSEDESDPLILDVNEDLQIKVHAKITKKLKPHQRSGIQFMWDSCYESVEQLKKGYEGSGCILAHCMGLGKTLQALGLIHTLFNYKDVTKTKHVLVVCPLSTVSNWRNEFKLAYKDIRHCIVQLYTIQNIKAAGQRFAIIKDWWRTGGLLIMGYECFGLMTNDQKLDKWAQNMGHCKKEDVLKALVNPGPDLVICDEGHLLRNKQTQRTLALNKIETKKRIVLTGTPLQNNLLEYYYMVNFVKPNLLGTEKEFKTNFINPINNGQFENSTAVDILFMKKRTHVLHKILNKTVQRVEDTELKQYLPALIDQALFVKLSDLQVNFYNTYLGVAEEKPVEYTAAGNINRKNFLADIQILRYICTHPDVVTIAKRSVKSKIKEQDVIDDNIDDAIDDKVFSKGEWYKDLVPESGVKNLELGTKMMVALGIVKEAAASNDKVLIFSQAHAEMDSLEFFLNQELNYKKGRDYNRMDGTISPEVRTLMCDKFNNPQNKRLRVFIMSTKVGGLGLNLTAANRVILMNVNWNPSYDTQSVFRAFRFGQNKAVYVYRLIAIDTMEEKMYQRQVTKLAVAHRVVDKHQITRHYSAADIQEFYSVRPSVEGERPLPNVPDDRVLANLIQKFQFLYKWHEHQALLTNRPEEDLNEQQKNAAWEEFNRKAVEPPPAGFPPPQPQFVSASSILNQPGPSGLQNKILAPAALTRPVTSELFADHNYSLPKTNSISTHRTNSADDFRISQAKYVPRPLFVDVQAPLGPRPNLSGLNVVSSQKARSSKPVQNQIPSKPMLDQPKSAPSQIRLGNAITITQQNSNAKTNPPPAHAQKPSISIIPQPPLTRNISNITNTKPPPFVPKGSTIVQNPLNLTKNVHPVNLNQTMINEVRIQKEKPKYRSNGVIGNDAIKRAQTNNGSQKIVTTLPPKTVIASSPKDTILLKKSLPSPLLVRPVITSSTTSTSDPLLVPTSTTASNHQSPLQKQMRNFMEHLHQLQLQSMKPKEGDGLPNLGDSNFGRVWNPTGNNQGIPSNTDVPLPSRPIVRVGPKPLSPVIGRIGKAKVTGLNAAKNLSHITKTYHKAQDSKIVGVTNPTSESSVHPSTVRVVPSISGPNSFTATSRVIMPNNTGFNGMRTNGSSPRVVRKIITNSPKSIPINTVTNPAGQTLNGVPRDITKVVGSKTTGGNARVNPVRLINGNVVTNAVSTNGIVRQVPRGANVSTGNKKVANLNKFSTQKLIPKNLPPSPQMPPIQLPTAAPRRSFSNATSMKTYQAKKNNSPSRTNSLPSLVQAASVSKSNKENRTKRKLSLRTNNNISTVPSSIDLSNDEENGHNSEGSLPRNMINNLKKKGVSINYLGKDVINLD